MFQSHTGRSAALMILLSTAALPQTAFGASYLETVQRGAKTLYTPSLAELTQAQTSLTTRTLDWQQPSLELYFDLPPAERISDIVLTLSADPLTRVAKNAPLEIQFNNSKPVPVLSNGRGFEARLPFDTARSRSRRNVIRISYPVPEGAECVAPAHGAWSIDLSASTLRMSGRAQKRHMSLSEVSDFLSQPGLSPAKVGLIARGPHGTDMQALAAQGIALRTPGVPKFSVSSQGNDFNVVMVTRDRLFDVTDDPMILNSAGARIFVPRGRPTELIFTADTDDEIVQMMKIFATRKLPNTRRPISSIGELNLQNRLDSHISKIEGKTALQDLAVASNIAPGSQSFRFGVLDPLASSGELLLRVSSSEDMSNSSRLRIALNGKVLGATKLDKKRKSVAFDIKPGALNTTSNILNIVPDLDPPKGYECPSLTAEAPNFSLGDGSRIALKVNAPSPVTELSSLTSTGGLFAQSESSIALPKGTSDYQSALRILGRLAKSAGHGMTLADYTRGASLPADKHRLIIGPSQMAKVHISGAPKALRDALSGYSSTGENLLEANFESYASAGSFESSMNLAANQQSSRKIAQGGIASLYGAGNGTLTGIITSAPGESFSRAGLSLVELDHWNALQGGVARWTSSSVVMAQTAQSDFGIKKPILRKSFELPDIGFSSVRLPEFDWPVSTWSEIEWPRFDIPQVRLPEFKWPRFNSAQTVPETSNAPVQGDVKLAAESINEARSSKPKLSNATPRLKPAAVSLGTTRSSGLRGPFQFETKGAEDFGSFQDFRRNIRSKWDTSRLWVRTKMKSLRNAETLGTVQRATDRLQDRVEPAGRSLKSSIKENFPGQGLVKLGDRTVSVYGLMLILSFILVLLLMSLSKPASRLGGRH